QGAWLVGREGAGGGERRAHGYRAGRIVFSRKSALRRVWPGRMERAQSGKWQMVQDASFQLDKDRQSVAIPIHIANWPDETVRSPAPLRERAAGHGGEPVPVLITTESEITRPNRAAAGGSSSPPTGPQPPGD